MADEQMYQVGAYVSDATGLFEVIRVQKVGPALPRQQRQVTLEDGTTEDRVTIRDVVFDKKFTFVCARLTDEELYLRYKAVGKDYVPEPRPKPRLLSRDLTKNLMCR